MKGIPKLVNMCWLLGELVPGNNKMVRWYHNTACHVLPTRAHALDPVEEVAFDTSMNNACFHPSENPKLQRPSHPNHNYFIYVIHETIPDHSQTLE
jgi:hypothetical protein